MTFRCPPEGEWLGTIKVLCLGVGGFLSHLGDDIRHPSVPFGALTCLSRIVHFEFGKKIRCRLPPFLSVRIYSNLEIYFLTLISLSIYLYKLSCLWFNLIWPNFCPGPGEPPLLFNPPPPRLDRIDQLAVGEKHYCLHD